MADEERSCFIRGNFHPDEEWTGPAQKAIYYCKYRRDKGEWEWENDFACGHPEAGADVEGFPFCEALAVGTLEELRAFIARNEG